MRMKKIIDKAGKEDDRLSAHQNHEWLYIVWDKKQSVANIL